MVCAHFQNNMTAYLYGVLPQETSRSLEQHIRTCSSCAAALAQSRSEQALFSAWSDVPPPSDLLTKTLSRVQQAGSIPQDPVLK